MSANSPLVNAHITRVGDDGGDITTINQTWLQTAYAWLVSNSVNTSLLHWADPAFGHIKSGSNISRIYDLGSTWLPRTLDLTPRDSTKTTYSATGLNSLIPAFINADGSSQLYWGRGNRYNQLRNNQQLTIAALYARTQTASNICFAGTSTSSTVGTFFTNGGNYSFQATPLGKNGLVAGISLVHTAGTPGTIQFSVNDKTLTPSVASVTASGATTQIAIGTYDGTTMTAYSDATGGTGVTTLFKDPFFASDSPLRGAINDAIAAKPFLTVGDTLSSAAYPTTNTPPYTLMPNATQTYTNAYAQFKASCIIVLRVGLDATKAASLYNLLKTRAGI